MDWTTPDWIAVGALAGGAGGFGAVIACAAACSLRRRDEPPLRDAVIVAPHSDDCVILAGEYALAALSAGRSITVVYVTAGSRDPAAPQAATRRAEAEAAWTSAGCARDRIVFLGAPQSDVEGPSAWSPGDAAAVRDGLGRVLAAAPPGAVVVVPAEWESHVDHRAVRDVVLALLPSLGRPDLILLESAEYNALHDAVRNPRKTLGYVLRNLPFAGRIAGTSPGRAPTGFAGAGAELSLSPDARRFARKQELIRLFTSEFNAQLASLAAKPERFRSVGTSPGVRPDRPRGFVRVGPRLLHWNVLVLWTSIGLALFGAAALSGSVALGIEGRDPVGRAVAAVAGCGLAFHAWRRRAESERAFALTSLAAGALCSAI